MKKERKARVERNTNETQITLFINLDGRGNSVIKTPINFLSHMLEIFAKNALFDLEIRAEGDIEVDQHHLVEDVGIVLGLALKKALGDKKGINRAGYFVYPMDEALSVLALDISGRPNLKFKCDFKRRKIGDFDSDLAFDFFKALTDNAETTLHILNQYGRNDHHKIESIFKAFGKAMKTACSKDKRVLDTVPSTKGLL